MRLCEYESRFGVGAARLSSNVLCGSGSARLMRLLVAGPAVRASSREKHEQARKASTQGRMEGRKEGRKEDETTEDGEQ